MANKLFSNYKKVLLNKNTGRIINSDKNLEQFQNIYSVNITDPSVVWRVKHNFNSMNVFYEVFIIENDNYVKIQPEITFIDSNELIIEFNSAQTGMVTVLYLGEDYTTIGHVSPTPSPTPSPTETPLPSLTPTPTPTITNTPSPTVSNTPFPTITPSPTISLTPSVSLSPSLTVTPSVSLTPSITISPSLTPSASPSISVSRTPSPSISPTSTLTPTPTPTPSMTMPPVALISAGVDNTSICGTTIPLVGHVLVGNPSDYTFLWQQMSGPPAVIDNPNSLITFFTSTVSQDRTFRLWANKGEPNQTYADVNIFGTPSEIMKQPFSRFQNASGLSFSVFANQPQFVVNNYSGGNITDSQNGISWKLLQYSNSMSNFYMSLERYNGSGWDSIWSTTDFSVVPYNVSPVNRTGTFRVKVTFVSNGRTINAVSDILNGSSTPFYNIGASVIPDTLKTYVGQVVKNYQNLQVVKYNPTLVHFMVDNTNSTDTIKPLMHGATSPDISITRTNYTRIQQSQSDSIKFGINRLDIVPNATINRSSGSSIGN